MILTVLWTTFAMLTATFAILTGSGGAVSAAAMDAAASAVALSVSICGPICLWTGLGKLMDALGVSVKLSEIFGPVLKKLFPSSKSDPILAGSIAANFSANLLGLGNAATPMGIRAVRRMTDPRDPHRATDEMCRLVVMNTASIQLLPTTVAALRSNAGCPTPFDILPCVWVSSLISVAAGLTAAQLLSRRCHG